MITMSCTPEYLLKKYTEELAELEKSQKEVEEAYEKYIALDKQLDTIEGKISALTELVTPHSHIDLETDYGSSADELSEIWIDQGHGFDGTITLTDTDFDGVCG